MTEAFYTGRIRYRQIGQLSPVVFSAAEAGDAEARKIVDRLADEIVTMAGAMIRRVHLSRLDPDVVLAGGVFRTRDAAFYERIDAGIRAIAPAARVVGLTAPPVAGAALVALDRLSGGSTPPEASTRVRAGDRRLGRRASAQRVGSACQESRQLVAVRQARLIAARGDGEGAARVPHP